MKAFRIVLIAASLICTGTAANAHPRPQTAMPKPNAVLTASPTEIRIGFSEGLVAAFSGLEIKNADGQKIDVGTASVDPKDDKMLVMPINNVLAPGTYTVKWHIVGDDTHRRTGHYSFQVKP